MFTVFTPALFNPINPADYVKAILVGIGQSIMTGLTGLADWAMKGALGLLTATTDVHLDVIAGPSKALTVVAGLAALPVIIIAVTQAAVQGRPGEALRRGFLAPLATAVILLAADTLITGLLTLCSAASWALINIGLPGGTNAFVSTWGHVATGAGSAGGAPLAAVAMVMLVTALMAFTIWVELAMRGAVLYLLAAMVPLALVGLYWKRLSSWLVRLGEVMVAVALSQVVITMAMVLGTVLIANSAGGHAGSSGASLAEVVQGIALLFLASLGLPLTLKLVPMAVDAAGSAGAFNRMHSAAWQARGVRAGAYSASPIGVAQRLATAPVRVTRSAASTASSTVDGAATGGPRPQDGNRGSTVRLTPSRPAPPGPKPGPDGGGNGK